MDINQVEYQRVYNEEKFSFNGLNSEKVLFYRKKYGDNSMGKKKKISIFKRIINALLEPMILILVFACIITFGINIGNLIAGKECDFYECLGILGAISISVGLTVIMENKSEKAFETLKKLSEAISVTALRNGEKTIIDYNKVVVGDILFCEAGDKMVADGLIIECGDLEVDESSLSGESKLQKKKRYTGNKFVSENMLYSGSYLKSGYAKVLVLAVGKNAQIGKIATGLSQAETVTAPLSQKLNELSKKISIFGLVAAALTFALSLLRLYTTGTLNFEGVKNAFIQAVILIVAAVPEGLPATVAIALALSVVKLAKSNVIIKKLIAAETVGCVSVICSDKTGTLTVGKMQLNCFVINGEEVRCQKLKNHFLIDNIIHNTTAYFAYEKGSVKTYGNSTEQALINSLFAKKPQDLITEREKGVLLERESFSSKRKYMSSKINKNGKIITYLKGSIEKVVEFCAFQNEIKNYYLNQADEYAKRAERILAFAHKEGTDSFVFDGFCVISDNLRADVYKSVKNCQKAGISVKILTGDNKETALAIAKKLSLPCEKNNFLTGAEIENMSEEQLIELLPSVTVVARSTPETKLRVVKTLKKMGEIVAVTGDGVNDAPAVKNADIGISMGDGSEITKEASDIILLDNSFSVIVKAVSFGRNIYRNFQRFIFFQLTVNFSAVGIIVAFLLLGFNSPFTTLQLLWINIIMDGPLALSLGLERREEYYMEDRPVKRSDSIVTKKMFLRVLVHSFIIVFVIVMQKLYNFTGANILQGETVIFCFFVIFQLFNAINAREIGNKSVLYSFGKNRMFSVLLFVTLIFQILLTQFLGAFFQTTPLDLIVWLKIFGVSASIIVLSELYKLLYRIIKKRKFFKKISKRRKFA